MPRQAWSDKDALLAWTERETRHLDLVASWETLCQVYEALCFKDQMSDNMRLDEFKWVIKETNKFLTRVKNGLLKCKDPESAIAFLGTQFNSQEAASINSRQCLAYNKMKQQWIYQSIMQLEQLIHEGEAEDAR